MPSRCNDACPDSPPPPRRKPVIGIVGGIGAGKSLVARLFGQLGCGVVDADALAAQALRDPQVQRRLRQCWGDAVFEPDGQVNRKALAGVVFDRPDQLARLESIIHPYVLARRAELHRQFQQDPAIRAIVEDTPLLMEKELDRDCDVIVYVDAPLATRQKRVLEKRRWGPDELARREKRQLPLDTKAQAADHMVDNGGESVRCLEQVSRIYSQIIQEYRPNDQGSGT